MLVRAIHRAGLGCKGEVDHCLGNNHTALRHADGVDSLVRSNGLRERARVRQAHIFSSKANQAAGHVARILARCQHAPRVIQRRVRVSPAQGFVHGRYEVVVHVTVAVVHGRAMEGRQHVRLCHWLGIASPAHRRKLERIERDSSIPVSGGRKRVQGSVVRLHALEVLVVGERAAQSAFQRVRGELVEDNEVAAGVDGVVEREGWVFGRRADERDGALLDVREQRILLCLRPAVDLVDEQDGALLREAARILRPRELVAQFLHARLGGRERSEVSLRLRRYHVGH
mmetsp:Transcript_24988/g.77862  ORF Transcript_24988/g.77862 Transcript_24988/m.77862 type:complete len:285 (-) Transcript_24988:291-1145(-)